MRNIYKYSKLYSGVNPVFIEEDVFKTMIPLTTQANDKINKILGFCMVPRSRNEIQEFIKLNNREYFRKNVLNPLIKEGLLELTIPEKTTSPKQKYYTVVPIN